MEGLSDPKPNIPKIIFFKCLVVTTKTRLTFVNGLSLLFYLVSCMSAVEVNKVCLAVFRANSSMLAYKGQTALLIRQLFKVNTNVHYILTNQNY